MRVLLDTNVILDVWFAREPYWRDSAKLLGMAEAKEITAVICPTTVTTLHYLGKKVLGEQKARSLINSLIGICEIAELSVESFQIALESDVKDFEDAVIESVAVSGSIDYIATRNLKDFKNSRVKTKEPSCFVQGDK